MAIITFEKIAGDDEQTEIPDGYRHLNWDNFFAVDDDIYPGSGFVKVIHSGEASARSFALRKPAFFSSPDSDDDFDLNSGFFASAFATGLEVKVFGYDDGERVATKFLVLDVEQEFVTFGRKFDDIDEVKITARSDDGNTFFGVDDLFIDF